MKKAGPGQLMPPSGLNFIWGHQCLWGPGVSLRPGPRPPLSCSRLFAFQLSHPHAGWLKNALLPKNVSMTPPPFYPGLFRHATLRSPSRQCCVWRKLLWESHTTVFKRSHSSKCMSFPAAPRGAGRLSFALGQRPAPQVPPELGGARAVS